MTDDRYEFGETDKLSSRERELTEFLERMFDDEDRPYFVADEACLYDIYAGDNDEFVARGREQYGKTLSENDFRIPVWQLLDKLYDGA